jgi:hypothetical protein
VAGDSLAGTGELAEGAIYTDLDVVPGVYDLVVKVYNDIGPSYSPSFSWTVDNR